jgi:hypothetical protein
MGTYRPVIGRTAVFVLLVVGTAGTVYPLVREAGAAAPRWWYLAYLVGAIFWNAYWWGLRIATRFRLDARELAWQVAFRDGAIPLGDLTSVRSLRYLPSIVVVRGHGMPWLLVLPAKGFVTFVETLAARAPHALVELRPLARLAERLPGRPVWRPDVGLHDVAPGPPAVGHDDPPPRHMRRRYGSRPRHLRRDGHRPLV